LYKMSFGGRQAGWIFRRLSLPAFCHLSQLAASVAVVGWALVGETTTTTTTVTAVILSLQPRY
jgi:hypothetical protein